MGLFDPCPVLTLIAGKPLGNPWKGRRVKTAWAVLEESMSAREGKRGVIPKGP